MTEKDLGIEGSRKWVKVVQEKDAAKKKNAVKFPKIDKCLPVVSSTSDLIDKIIDHLCFFGWRGHGKVVSRCCFGKYRENVCWDTEIVDSDVTSEEKSNPNYFIWYDDCGIQWTKKICNGRNIIWNHFLTIT